MVTNTQAKAGLEILNSEFQADKEEKFLTHAYKFIKEQEGEKLNAYYCSAGKVTIGVGVTGKYQDGALIKITDKLPNVQASKDLFFWFLKTRCLPELPQTVDLNDNQKIALCSFIFNLGEGNWRSSTLKKKVISNPNDKSIRSEFLKWIYFTNPKTKVKEVLNGLKLRREREANLYFTNL